ncbi:migration and invasion-inhibitory protein [Xyrichtys novacula]|uniref:Migration and invasion-inhibitory protein n=1 Tax=Xyrichtys novacula TaxID=13765 RepID=A0AAV1EPC0_XYRNO|nr:migration and invasion-inhibitory protein [Xyrichtys novacula]
MSSLDRLDALRKLNKDLLKQLKQQREKLERLSGYSQSRERERETGAEVRRDPGPEVGRDPEVLTLTGGDPGPARAALAKPTVRFADECEVQHNILTPSATSKNSGGTTKHSTASDFFTQSDTHPEAQHGLQDSRPSRTESCQSEEQREDGGGITFQSDDSEEVSDSDRHHLQPLLGYDWIAGLLDAEDSWIERSDEFFNDLRAFRSLNKDECVHSPDAELLQKDYPALPLLTEKDDPEAHTDTHQCTFSYRINSRLFPVPLHSEECCPVCRKHKSSHPHTAAEPALVRVSIPRSTILPPHKYKAHRRCSFDPSDSLGLPSHCLSGWSNKGQSVPPPPSSLDLRSSLEKKIPMEEFLAPKESSNRVSDQTLDVSRLARHKFQHFSPKRKLRGSSYSLS